MAEPVELALPPVEGGDEPATAISASVSSESSARRPPWMPVTVIAAALVLVAAGLAYAVWPSSSDPTATGPLATPTAPGPDGTSGPEGTPTSSLPEPPGSGSQAPGVTTGGTPHTAPPAPSSVRIPPPP
jgi:hypothetical protein